MPLVIKMPEAAPRFCVLTEKDLSRKAPLSTMARSVDTEQTRVAMAKNREKLAQRKRIQDWTQQALQHIQQNGQLDFSPFFFHILAAEQNDLNIPVRVAQRLVKQCNGRQYTVRVAQQEYHDPDYQNLSLWNMTILKKI